MPDDRQDAGRSATSTSRPPTADSTVTLVERAHRGDVDALERLMARHLTPLRRWARGRLPVWARDAEDTDDLVQDALLRTFKRLDSVDVRGPGALQAYLRQAVLNHIRNELRKKARRPDVGDLAGFDADHGGRSPLEEAIGREAVERYEQALARLRPEEREAIIGRIEMGYSYEELADALGKPSSEAARKAAKRALVRLVREMDQLGR
jgi:RNA polymerase sigma factor (sigma-70 family)